MLIAVWTITALGRPLIMHEPQLEQLKVTRCAELSEALRGRVALIVHKWQSAVRKVLPMADELTARQLSDDIPPLLNRIAEVLNSDQENALTLFLENAPIHGQTRFHQDYNLNELLIEYHILRRIVVQQIAEALGRNLALEESISVNLALDVAVRRSTVAYTDHQAGELKAGTEAYSKYLSFLSHDIRGGLNGVLLMIEVLRRDLSRAPEFTESLDDLEVMKRSILETVGTMERFLTAERLRKGVFKLRWATLDLAQFLSAVLLPYAHQAREKGIALVQEAPAGRRVVADRDLLSLIVQNLASNAVKFTSAGTITVGMEEGLEGRPGFRLSVRDQGPGIAPEQLERIFEPFQQGQTHGQPGLGLGLSIAKQGADLMGARLWAESKVGEGTTFQLEVPAPPEPDQRG